MSKMISLIAALAENRCIGINNDMPWYIPEDFKHFKTLTLEKPVIMGRKTFESILHKLGKPLPGRTNIVISRGDYKFEGVPVFKTLNDAIAHAQAISPDIMIIGGASVYEQALPIVDRMYLTFVHKQVEGDAFFPAFNRDDWNVISEDRRDGDPSFTFTTLERKV